MPWCWRVKASPEAFVFCNVPLNVPDDLSYDNGEAAIMLSMLTLTVCVAGFVYVFIVLMFLFISLLLSCH